MSFDEGINSYRIPQAKDTCEKVVQIKLAGRLAERRYKPREYEFGYWDDWRDVYEGEGIELFLTGLTLTKSEDENIAYLRLLEIQADSILERAWTAVDSLAKELFKKRRLEGGEIVGIIERELPHGI